ncbi:gamma-glutamyl-gamma-aminobutyrate hydrolase family protein [Thermus oshimai]|uniref:gamma-glutamyl-gamma-aminobutyrate hydrolase family protein n=1 Tax=Thermus oshimai TaxID=56957 RepID=UPI0002D8420B|nr:gamma-glutamyl-gamma-aminobutyrate hydrolase family protein [Thermus oshimai]
MARFIGIATQSTQGFYGVRTPYLEALVQVGLTPVLLPPQDPEGVERLLPHLDGLLLPGGVDVDPALYGEEPGPGLGEVHPERDALELRLARYAAKEGMPLLGICRGLQVLNVALGGSLHQDLQSPIQHYQKAPWGTLGHSVRQVGKSPLEGLFPETFRVNSYHHQGVKALGQGLRPVAVAPDGLVEAVVLEGHPLFLGVQWHPELLPSHRGLFRLLAGPGV